MRLKKFDPFQMPDDLVRQVSTGRDALLREIMGIVSENLASRESALQHIAVVAPRGTGKTFVLRLVGLEVAERASSGEQLHFLHMPEELPDIQDPAALLREILLRLTGGGPEGNDIKWRGTGENWDHLAAAIDAALETRFGPGQGLLVLCLENIEDLIENALPKPVDQRRFRAWLDRADGRIMLIAASAAGKFDTDYDKPLFHVVRTFELAIWSPEETIAYLDRVMTARSGRTLGDRQRAKARAIAEFTGGSPRMAAALAEIVTADDVLTAAQTLDALIDNLQEYYLGRLRDMGTDARKCVGKLLREGENISQSELARRLGEPQSVVAQAVKGLVAKAILVVEEAAGSREKLCRIADRVFVHFYRMRILHHGQSVSVLEPIIELLIGAFSDSERASESGRLFRIGRPDDAAVLLGTLPRLDPLTAEEHWWKNTRGFVAFAGDRARAWGIAAGPWRDLLAELLADRERAMDVAARAQQATEGAADAGWSGLTAGLAYLAAGLADAASHQFETASLTATSERTQALAFLAWARTFGERRDFPAALEYAEKADDLAARLDDPFFRHWTLSARAFYVLRTGNAGAAEALYQQAADVADAAGNHVGLARARGNLSVCARDLGDPDAALTMARSAHDAAVRSGDAGTHAEYALRLSDVLRTAGQLDEALRLAAEAKDAARQSGNPWLLLLACEAEGYALFAAGRAKDAVATAREALDAAKTPFPRARAHAVLAFAIASFEWDVDQASAEEAVAEAQRALDLAGAVQPPSDTVMLALQAQIVARAARRDYEPCLTAATWLEDAARQADSSSYLGIALDHIVFALCSLKRHDEAVASAQSALAELATRKDIDPGAEQIIFGNLIISLRALGRLPEVETTGTALLQRILDRGDHAAAAGVIRELLPAAMDIGAHDLALRMTRQILGPDGTAYAREAEGFAGAILGAITAGRAWSELGPLVTGAIWDAAAGRAGHGIALALWHIDREKGRPAAFAAFHGLLTVLTPIIAAEHNTPPPQHKILADILSNPVTVRWDAGLLTDIADAVTEALPGRFTAECRMIGEIARFNASGQDRAMLNRIDPDVARMLRAILLPVEAPPAPPKKRTRAVPRKSRVSAAKTKKRKKSA